MKLILFIFIIGNILNAQNVQFSVKDSITKKQLSYVNLSIDNKYQMVSNENGAFVIEDLTIQKLEFSCIGYETKIINSSDLTSEVFLSPSITKLKEIVITTKPKLKPENIIIDTETHRNFSKSFISNQSMSLAFFVEGSEYASYLKIISIPIMPLSSDIPNQASHYKTVISIETLEVTADKTPGGYYYDFKQIAIIDFDKDSKKIEIALNEVLPIPENGLFIQITILGKADTTNKLILEMPYSLEKVNGKEMHFLKLMKPYFPLVKEQKGVPTFVKIRSDLEMKWFKINLPQIDNSIKDNPVYNIGFGYTKKVYK